MPRLPPRLIYHAAQVDRHIPTLLRECRDLNSARNELRWMKETILEKHLGIEESGWDLNQAAIWHESTLTGKRLQGYVRRRAKGEPLQYILGTQPFGNLEIKCKRNVLIPRPETETYSTQIGKILRDGRTLWSDTQGKENTGPDPALTIADFCSGSGCISLLLHSLLKPVCDQQATPGPRILGFDMSHHALASSKDNLQHNIRLKTLHENAATDISFHHLHVLSLAEKSHPEITTQLSSYLTTTTRNSPRIFDAIISNPPYISPTHYALGGPTSKSVRKFEPKLALVPPSTLSFPAVNQADQFYVALLRIAAATKPRLLVMEVGDTEQALRVRELIRTKADGTGIELEGMKVEIWRDDGSRVEESENANMRGGGGDERSGMRKLVQKGEEIESRAVVVWFRS